VLARFWMLPNLLASFLAGNGVALMSRLSSPLLSHLFSMPLASLVRAPPGRSAAAVVWGARVAGYVETGAVVGMWFVLGRSGLAMSARATFSKVCCT